jgi:hypothetical protein
VFGLRHQPYIAVQRPKTFGRPSFAGQWAWSDTVAGWSWRVPAGTRTAVEVYSDADEVELLVGDRSIGRRPAGREHGFMATFEVEVTTEDLLAVARTGGTEVGRAVLRAATGSAGLHVEAERAQIVADDHDLAYLPIELRDAAGTLVHDDDRMITVTVSGPGRLLAVGSARPDQQERFDTGSHTTFDGRVLAIVRPTGAGVISVRVTGAGLAGAETTISSIAPTTAAPAPTSTPITAFAQEDAHS